MAGDTSVEVVVHQLNAEGARSGLVGMASMSVTDEAILLTPRGEVRVLTLRPEELSGVVVRGASRELFLHPSRIPAVVLRPESPDDASVFLELAGRMERTAFALPELTRGLRRVGGRRMAFDQDHDRWFGSLMTARRRAERADGWAARLDAFDADALRSAIGDALHSSSVARYPSSPPDQRALEAALEEHAAPLLESLHSLRGAAAAVRGSDDAHRVDAWRDWVAAIRASFMAADRGWGAMLPHFALHQPATLDAVAGREGTSR